MLFNFWNPSLTTVDFILSRVTSTGFNRIAGTSALPLSIVLVERAFRPSPGELLPLQQLPLHSDLEARFRTVLVHRPDRLETTGRKGYANAAQRQNCLPERCWSARLLGPRHRRFQRRDCGGP